ncbi:MAG: SagB/ThcOx family dehydrogenase [Thermoplasmatota archaeon]
MIKISLEKIGDKYQQETKYYPGRFGEGPDWALQPDLYKDYPNNPKIMLPKIIDMKTQSLHQAILTRKSIRDFSQKPLSLEQLSYLLWASTGIQRIEKGFAFRTAPSAGALYPIETYLVINNVEEIPQGVYHYNISDHYLEELKKGDCRSAITEAALNQPMCSTAASVFIWTAIFNRSKCKYAQRAYRYIYLDAGHIAQNLALSASSIHLGTCQIAALYDDEVNKIIDIDGRTESTIYLSVVGVPFGE